MKEFGFVAFLTRWVPAFILVAAFYNPTSYSFYHWVSKSEDANLPLQVLIGLALLAGLLIYVVATFKAMGYLGTTLLVVAAGIIVWAFSELGWLTVDETSDAAWLGIIVLATILAIGISWAGIWRRLTGQVSTDSLDDDHSH